MTIQELTAKMMAKEITAEDFQREVLKLAEANNRATASRSRPFKVNVSKTGGMTVPSRKLGAGSYPVWGYASQWLALLSNAPDVIEAIFSRKDGPLPGDNGQLSVYVPGENGEDGTSRPLKASDLPDKDAYIRAIIERLESMLPAKAVPTPTVNPTPEVTEPETLPIDANAGTGGKGGAKKSRTAA